MKYFTLTFSDTIFHEIFKLYYLNDGRCISALNEARLDHEKHREHGSSPCFTLLLVIQTETLAAITSYVDFKFVNTLHT